MAPWTDDPAAVRPMLASTGPAPPESSAYVYEPKYDGIRALASIDGQGVRLWSRLGNDKTAQFPEVVAALRDWARGLDGPVLLDGEIVALDVRGTPIGFQHLQGRIHLTTAPRATATRARGGGASPGETAAAFVAFDILRMGDEDLRRLPLRDRRARLDRLLAGVRDPHLRLSEQVVGVAGRALRARAEAHGWEGLVAKRLDAPYTSGRRSADWRKLKLEHRQTCVVGGWTDPRGSRPFFGALLLGVFDEDGRLQSAGSVGAGFSDAELGRLWKRLHALQTKACPFSIVPRTKEPAHWVKPRLVAEVRFTEWTADGNLRHPTYLGMRDDIDPTRVTREPDASAVSGAPAAPRTSPRRPRTDASPGRPARAALSAAAITRLLGQIDAIEHGGGNGTLALPGGDRLDVTNLGKVFWPALALTKGDLFRHYVRAAPYLIPALADRPLVMKRFPNGIAGKPFYQHSAPDTLPPGVRVEAVGAGPGPRQHLVGGSLVTLLYTTQLAAISQDPWCSRAGAGDVIDYVAIDLDPPDDLPFARVLDVARWVRDALATLKAPGFAKTSGVGGLHIYVPMPPGTPHAAGLLFAQIVATLVAKAHPRHATLERSVTARGGRVCVDCLQNAPGKTLASAYSARANAFAGVSTPLTWDELDAGVVPQDFTIATFAARLTAVGDLWAPLRKAKGADLRAVLDLGAEGATTRKRKPK